MREDWSVDRSQEARAHSVPARSGHAMAAGAVGVGGRTQSSDASLRPSRTLRLDYSKQIYFSRVV